METLAWLLAWFFGLGACAYFKQSLKLTSGLIVGGLILTTWFSGFSAWGLGAAWILAISGLLAVNHPEFRHKKIVTPLFKQLKANFPNISKTEREALEAGTVGWEGEFFKGRVNWHHFSKLGSPKLTQEEQAFIEGPVHQACEMVNDWEVTHTTMDLSPELWAFLKKEGFFALIIPKEYGGKGFSAFAHAEILSKLAGRSITLFTTVSVPNSLGPSELLLHYGTQEQKDYFLPRLATGQEIPCFGLTGPHAGSDAGAITDSGIICRGQFEGKDTLGIRLNWNKRYITLAPVATLLGLAFKLKDPDHLVGQDTDLGITCALIPTDLPGITIGRRHYPLNIPFQNGPTSGKDVFVPIDSIIGGIKRAGQGWKMLVESLSCGRAISLPASSIGGAKVASFATGAYAQIRRQFRHPIAKFEGVQEALAHLCGYRYIVQAAGQFTSHCIDRGEKPSVPSAILKYHTTEMGRKIACHAMDVHAGKGVMLGPKNYLARSYEGSPIAITVEGANILTRNLIIFGQGAIRCHPYVLEEMEALAEDDVSKFETLLNRHTQHVLSNVAGAFFHGITGAKCLRSPKTGPSASYYRHIQRASAAFALATDVALGVLGGKLKFKESLSARLGDMLSMLYLCSTVLHRFEHQGKMSEEVPLMQWACQYCLHHFWEAMEGFLNNFPNPWVARGLRVIVMPFGRPNHAPKDRLNKQITELFTRHSLVQQNNQNEIFISQQPGDPLFELKETFDLLIKHQSLLARLDSALKNNAIEDGSFEQRVHAAQAANLLDAQEVQSLLTLGQWVDKVVAVDDFEPEELNGGAQSDNLASTPNPIHSSKNKAINL